MHALTEKDVRASFVNASLRERNAIPLPDRFPDVEWDAIDFVGWRDPKLPLMGGRSARCGGHGRSDRRDPRRSQ